MIDIAAKPFQFEGGEENEAGGRCNGMVEAVCRYGHIT